MGRNAQPISILQAKGAKHLTKQEIEGRREAEIHFGDRKLKCPDFVKSDIAAYKKWKEITALYSDVDFVSGGDSGLLARYCKSFSEYQDLLESYQRIKEIHYDMGALDKFLDAEVENDEETASLFSYKAAKQIRDMVSVNALLAIEASINKKMDMLIKMEDRLFLNPLSKVKNVPKPKEEEPESKWDKYKSG